MARTVMESKSLRKMSDDDLKHLANAEVYQSHSFTFGRTIAILKKMYKIVQKESKGDVLTGQEKKTKQNFEDEYDHVKLYIQYRNKNYRKTLEAISNQIKFLTRQTNASRLEWDICTGVNTEMRRRGL